MAFGFFPLLMRALMAVSSHSGLMFQVLGSLSTKMGWAPW